MEMVIGRFWRVDSLEGFREVQEVEIGIRKKHWNSFRIESII